MDAERCVMCGVIIPEGTQVCEECIERINKKVNQNIQNALSERPSINNEKFRNIQKRMHYNHFS